VADAQPDLDGRAGAEALGLPAAAVQAGGRRRPGGRLPAQRARRERAAERGAAPAPRPAAHWRDPARVGAAHAERHLPARRAQPQRAPGRRRQVGRHAGQAPAPHGQVLPRWVRARGPAGGRCYSLLVGAEKEAAGVVNLALAASCGGDKQLPATGVVYAFPQCMYADDFVSTLCPRLNVWREYGDQCLILVLQKGSG